MKPPDVEGKPHHSDFWRIIRNRWGTISFTVLLFCLVAMGVSQRAERKCVGRVSFAFLHNSNKEDRGHWLETEIKMITSNETMLQVVQKLNLTRSWKLNGDESAAITRLRGMVETPGQGDQDLIIIEVYSPEAGEAVMLANAVADAYEQRHQDDEGQRWKERRQLAINTLAKEMTSQRKLVESKRSEVLRMKDLHRIVDFSAIDGSLAPSSQHAADFMSAAQRLELQLNAPFFLTEQDTLFEQAPRMKPYLGPMESARSVLYQARRKLTMLKDNGFGNKHPTVKNVQGLANMLSEQLALSEEDFKSTLRFKLKIAKDSLAFIEEKIDDGLMGDQTEYAEYLSVKNECEQQANLLKEMQEDFMRRHLDPGCGMPTNPIMCLELARQGQIVVRPHIPLLLAVGLSVVWVLGITLAYLRESMRTSPSE